MHDLTYVPQTVLIVGTGTSGVDIARDLRLVILQC